MDNEELTQRRASFKEAIARMRERHKCLMVLSPQNAFYVARIALKSLYKEGKARRLIYENNEFGVKVPKFEYKPKD